MDNATLTHEGELPQDQKCMMIVAGQHEVVTVLRTVFDTDGFDGRGYVVERVLAPGQCLTVSEDMLDPVSDVAAAIIGLMTDPSGASLFREVRQYRTR